MSNKYTSVYDWLKYIKANVVGINLRELRLIYHHIFYPYVFPYFPYPSFIYFRKSKYLVFFKEHKKAYIVHFAWRADLYVI